MQKRVRAGRPRTFPHEKVLRCLHEYKSELFHGRGLASKSDNVWKRISDIMHPVCNISANYLYTIVRLDRKGIRTALLHESAEDTDIVTDTAACPVNTDDDKSCSNETESYSSGKGVCDDDDNSSTSQKSGTQEKLSFTMTLSVKEWNSIKPEEVQYSSRSNKRHHIRVRKYNTLKRNVWTNVINEHFWKETRLPCALRYRSSFVRSEDCFVTIKGQCCFCHANLTSTIPNEPAENEEVKVDCIYVGNFSQRHPTSCKRRLSGKNRRDAVIKLCDRRMSSSFVRQIAAKETMRFGDVEPAHVPSLAVLRKCKSDAKKEGRIDVDPVKALCICKYRHPYSS